MANTDRKSNSRLESNRKSVVLAIDSTFNVIFINTTMKLHPCAVVEMFICSFSLTFNFNGLLQTSKFTHYLPIYNGKKIIRTFSSSIITFKYDFELNSIQWPSSFKPEPWKLALLIRYHLLINEIIICRLNRP